MAKAFKCDVCEEYVDGQPQIWINCIGFESKKSLQKFECCGECMKSFYSFLEKQREPNPRRRR